VFSSLGRFLADQGYDVLVFDHFGYGNSSGQSIDVDVRTLDQDVRDACALLSGAGVDRLTLLGVRWGAALACRGAAHENVDSLFLVNPIKKWKPEFMKALRANVAGQYAIFRKTAMTRDEIIEELTAGKDCVRAGYAMNNIEGYFFSRGFLEQSREIELPVELPGQVKQVTIFTIPEKKGAAAGREDPLAAEFRSSGVNCDHETITDDNAFWINNEVFTSVAPRLNQEIGARLNALENGKPNEAGRACQEPAVFDSFVKDGIREEAVNFTSREGISLYGVLYLPDGREASNLAFVFSHGGLIGMNGAYRFHTRLARRFAAEGFPCLCFDPHGMGRAHGSHDGKDRVILFREINRGLLADDVGDAVAFLQRKIGGINVALFGVCGGAITNIIAHGRYDNVNASIQLSVPVMLPALTGGIVRMSAGFAKFYLGMYVKKIFNPKAWWRFVSLQSDYEKIFKALKAAAGGVFARLGLKGRSGAATKNSPLHQARKRTKRTSRPSPEGEVPQPTPDEGLRFNDAYLEAYRSIISRGDRIVFFYGENDNFKWEFNNEFAEKYPEDLEAGKGLITIEEIKQANHMYTLREWQDQIGDFCLKWAAETDLSRKKSAEA
jgi:pimeloyl-ACP methyl ester carboxylesterase